MENECQFKQISIFLCIYFDFCLSYFMFCLRIEIIIIIINNEKKNILAF